MIESDVLIWNDRFGMIETGDMKTHHTCHVS